MNSSEHLDKYTDLLMATDALSEAEIAAFRDSLSNIGKEVFDRVSEVRKRVIIIVSRMTDAEIDDLEKTFGFHSPVFHSFRSTRQLYALCLTPNDY